MDLFYIIMYIIMFVTLLIFLIDTFVPEAFRGKLILKIYNVQKRRRIGYSILWGGLLMFWLSTLILYRTWSIDWTNNKLFTNYYMILFCLLMIVRTNRPVEIRVKAMYFDFGFHKFDKVISYSWKSDSILRIHYYKILKQDDYYNVEFKDKDIALKVDEVLQRYVKKESTSITT